MKRNLALWDWLDVLYVPVDKKTEFAELRTIIKENDYRGLTQLDQGEVFDDCLIIDTKGNGERESFRGFRIAKIEVGDIGIKYANIAIHYKDSDKVDIKRIDFRNIKVNLPW